MVLGLQQQYPSGLMGALVILVVLFNAVWTESQDYYKLLGVSKEANTREIRQAFKKLALTMHPDKNPVSYSQNGMLKTFNVASNVRKCLLIKQGSSQLFFGHTVIVKYMFFNVIVM